MKLIIAGSRDITVTDEQIGVMIDSIYVGGLTAITEIVSGHYRGIDFCGERFAKANGIKLKLFPADWNKYGLGAGPRRNAQMAEYADELLLIWDGKSKGSKNVRARMVGRSKPVHEVIWKDDEFKR
jgi:hypothetical protein